MSKLLSYSSFLVDIGTTVWQFMDEFKGKLTAAGWQVLNDYRTTLSGYNYLDVIPPVNQTIGSSFGKEVTRFIFGASGVWVRGYYLTATPPAPHTITFDITMSSNLTIYLTIDGTPLTFTGSESNTMAQNATMVATKLSASTDWRVQEYTWTASGVTVTGVAKTNVTGFRFSADLYTGNPTTTYNTYLNSYTEQTGVTVDYSTGFIYFLSIHERSIVLATKTTVGYYGPIYAQYADHQIILNQTPANCAPIELVIGLSSAGSTSNPIWGRTTHIHGMGQNTASQPIAGIAATWVNSAGNNRYSYPMFDPSASRNTTVFTDYTNYGYAGWGLGYEWNQFNTTASVNYYSDDNTPTMLGIPIRKGDSTQLSYFTSGQQIVSNAVSQWYTANDMDSFRGVKLRPFMPLDDIYTFLPAGTNESLNYSRVLTLNSTLVTAIDSSTAITTIDLTDASAFPTAGNIIIGTETFEYTGKIANQLIGVTRGKYGSTKVAHAQGDMCYSAQWFVKINSGALLAGAVKPV